MRRSTQFVVSMLIPVAADWMTAASARDWRSLEVALAKESESVDAIVLNADASRWGASHIRRA
jgi:hypothetical protein